MRELLLVLLGACCGFPLGITWTLAVHQHYSNES